MIVNGTELTKMERMLLSLGDVVDADELRDIPALRRRQAEVSTLGRFRLQQQIDALELAAGDAATALRHAARP